jgi:hypothetical protein
VQKVDTGKVYAMKSLQKAEMLKRDQVRSLKFSLSTHVLRSEPVAGPRSG